ILHLYRQLLALRRSEPALRRGDAELLEAPEAVLAVKRTGFVVAVNFSDQEVEWSPPGDWVVRIASSGGRAGSAYGGTLGPEEAVLLG
ncbi:MAG TPA: DUF3459 domain-containing protein, partial [Acidimicrobiales bacterium]|nr:DUF3459 domain-containing protein [Acidimicrobiales bacterium]